MTSQRFVSRLARAAAFAAVPLLVLTVSATEASAGPKHHKQHHKHHARYASCAHGQIVHAPVVVYRPYAVARPYVVRRPCVAPYPPLPYGSIVVVPAAPPVYGTVGYDRDRDGVDGFIGINGPNVRLGIAF